MSVWLIYRGRSYRLPLSSTHLDYSVCWRDIGFQWALRKSKGD